jgi:hypothetical protein
VVGREQCAVADLVVKDVEAWSLFSQSSSPNATRLPSINGDSFTNGHCSIRLPTRSAAVARPVAARCVDDECGHCGGSQRSSFNVASALR